MQLVRETHPYPESFPFVFKYRRLVNAEKKTKYHYHDWYEIIFAHKGTSSFFVDPNVYEVNSGDLLIIPGDVIHQALPNKRTKETGYTRSLILFNPAILHQVYLGEKFDYLEAFKRFHARREYKLSVPEHRREVLEHYLAEINNEFTACSYGCHHAVLSLLQQFLIVIARLEMENCLLTDSRAFQGKLWMKDILTYIENHLSENLTLKHLAAQALVSPAYFSREFKETTGYHLTTYLRIKRVMLAKELLTRTTLPIDIIAERCSFASVSHFYRSFRQYLGYTPGEFRKNHALITQED